jgi:hypothetical protein
MCVSNPADTARVLGAMHAGTERPADVAILQARLLTDRAHASLRSLRARDGSAALVLIADAHDGPSRRLAGWLAAAIVSEPPNALEIELIAESAALPRHERGCA